MNFKKFWIAIFSSFFVLLIAIIFSLHLGSIDISFSELFFSFGKNNSDKMNIIIGLRFPRILTAIAIGGGLSVAGAVFQVILKNPLAEPYILGVSSGGTFGALISFALGLSFFFTQLFSFSGAILILLLLFKITSKTTLRNSTTLLLSGVMIGAFFGSGILIILTLMRENLQTAIFWLVGSLSFANPENAYFIILFSFTITIVLTFNGFKLNLLASDSEQIVTLGINQRKTENFLLFISTILVGGLVSISGVIGFIGLIVPHIVRIAFGFDNRFVVPLSFIWGGILLLLADSFARTIILPSELPVGAITALFGAPIFIYLLRKNFYFIK